MSVKAPLHAEKQKTYGGVQWDTVERETKLVCPLSGKKIYRKGVDLGLLANAGADTTAHGITGIGVAEGRYFRVRGFISDGTTMEDLVGAVGVTSVEVNATNIVVTSSTDLSSHRAFVLLEYTKT